MIISSLVISRYVVDVLNIIGGVLGLLGSVYLAIDLLGLKQTFQRLTLVLLEVPVTLLPFAIFYEFLLRERSPSIGFFITLGFYVLYASALNLLSWSTSPVRPRPLRWSYILSYLGVGLGVGMVVGIALFHNLGPLPLVIASVAISAVGSFLTMLLYTLIITWLTWRTYQLSTKTLAVIGVVFLVCSVLLLMAGPVADLLSIQVS